MDGRSGATLTSSFLPQLTLPKQNRRQQLLSLHPLLPTAKWPEWLTLSRLVTLAMPCTMDLGETIKDPRWVPAVVTKVFGPRSVNVRVFPHGATWKRPVEQLQYQWLPRGFISWRASCLGDILTGFSKTTTFI